MGGFVGYLEKMEEERQKPGIRGVYGVGSHLNFSEMESQIRREGKRISA